MGGVLVWYVGDPELSLVVPIKSRLILTLMAFILEFQCRSIISPDDVMLNYPHLLISGTGFAFGFLVVHLCGIQLAYSA